jgi:Protein of unknown function (DUF1553)/Protein of unknown function (DUF1549)/Planctomycete cytochrome C
MNRSLIVLTQLLMLVWGGGIAHMCSAADGDVKAANDARTEFFESHIRPALVKHCLACHSNETEVNGGLLLDSLAGWKNGGDSGKVIEPGDPTASLLVKAIEYDDPHLQMPPDGRMPKQTIELFRKWIHDGAVDPRSNETTAKISSALSLDRAQEHWAYRPIVLPSLPDNEATSAIDRFVNSALTSNNLKPVPLSTKATLLRRLSFDLHGVPPTPEEILDFEADTSDDAYARVVDRLLASPRYAERMARHWLDVVRYGESLTLRGFVLGNAWRYRDYCIQAFEEDRPWNEVMREQIAGDLMSSEDRNVRSRQLVAAGFWLMGNTNLEEQDKQQLEMDIVDEQLDTFGKAFLGQTLGCARCHDHKFDPIPTQDYYALAGVLKASQVVRHSNVSNWIDEPLPLPADEQERFETIEAKSKEFDDQITTLRKVLTRLTKRSSPMVEVKELSGIVVDDIHAKKIGEWQPSKHTAAYVGEGYIHDKNEQRGSKTVSFEPEKLPPGTYEVRLAYAGHASRASNAKVTVYSADGDSPHSIDQREPGAIDGLWVSLGRYRFEKDGQAYVTVSNEDADGFVIADAVQFLPAEEVKIASKNVKELAVGSGLSEESESDDQANDTKEIETQIKQLEKKKKKFDEQLQERPKYLAMIPVAEPSDLPIHIRGDVHNLGKVVNRGTLQLVNIKRLRADRDQPFDRLRLSEWLIATENPLPARVMVNRVWSWLMGEGIVRTLDNFGTTGEAPSNSELLDYLATQFVSNNWSIRSLVREIVLTEAYQRSSIGSTENEVTDPENRFLWRGHRRRLDAETIRDAILVISGQLDDTRYGSHLPKALKSDYGFRFEGSVRSIYIPALRNSMLDLFDVFDIADPSSVVGKRNRSTTASQALWMMNHSWLHEKSRETAERVLNETTGTRDELFDQTSLRVIGRVMRPNERKAFQEFLGSDQKLLDVDRLAVIVQTLIQSVDFRFPE